MPTLTFTKVNDWPENMAEVADMANDTFIIALSNTAPASETSNPLNDGNGVLANVTQISYTNLSSRTLTVASSSTSSGTYTFDLNDLTLTASGAVATWRYIYIYDDTPTSPTDPLVAHFDYGSAVTMANTETVDININASGLFTVA